MIENEGPRGQFRRKIGKRIAAWTGEPFAHNVQQLRDPWAAFSFAESECIAALAGKIACDGIDAVIVGPLISLGAKGTWSPDEVQEFSGFISALRQLAGRPFHLVINHHENKAGDISGAWGRLPDTVLQVQRQGPARTHLHWRKTRHASAHHDTQVNLVWAEDGGGGFILEPSGPARDHRAEVLAVFKPGEWLKTEEIKARAGGRSAAVGKALAFQVDAGNLIFRDKVPGQPNRARFYALPGTAPIQAEIPA